MISTARTPLEYIESLPEERQAVITQLRQVLLDNLPKGFSEQMRGMLHYVVPHDLYPEGYHCDPKQALPFISLASQKNFVALYHMGLYADPDLLEWFVQTYPEHSSRKLDMGKSCIRFKNMKHIPYELIGELATKMTVKDWIRLYEKAIKK